MALLAKEQERARAEEVHQKRLQEEERKSREALEESEKVSGLTGCVLTHIYV